MDPLYFSSNFFENLQRKLKSVAIVICSTLILHSAFADGSDPSEEAKQAMKAEGLVFQNTEKIGDSEPIWICHLSHDQVLVPGTEQVPISIRAGSTRGEMAATKDATERLLLFQWLMKHEAKLKSNTDYHIDSNTVVAKDKEGARQLGILQRYARSSHDANLLRKIAALEHAAIEIGALFITTESSPVEAVTNVSEIELDDVDSETLTAFRFKGDPNVYYCGDTAIKEK